IGALFDDLALAALRQVLHHYEVRLRAARQIHRAADRRYRMGRAGVPVREVTLRGYLKGAEDADVQVPPAYHRERIGVVEVGAAREQRHRLFAGVDEVVVFLARRRCRAHPEYAVLAVQGDVAILRQAVGDQRRKTNAEIHVGTARDVARDAGG